MGTTERDRGVQPSLAGATGADADAELEARLRRANERIERLCEATDRSGNVVHFRMARYLESLDELAADLNNRPRPIASAGTHDRRTFERDLGALEDEVGVGFAELASAMAAEQGDTHREMRADARLLETNAEVAKRWWGRMFGPRRRDPAAPRQVGPRPADEGGEARRKET